MKAVGLYKYLPLTDPNCLLDLEVNLPVLQKNEVLVEVKAVGVNPLDAKLRTVKLDIETTPRILGWDGAGKIVQKGEECKLFNLGDEVIFTGNVMKNGANAQYVALHEYLVGPKPKNLTFEQAAAMPLTSVTAYESLYERLLLSEKDAGKSILIINSGGGVGSVASQLASNLGLKVIGTASRPESYENSIANGASIVLNHRKDLIPQLADNGFGNGVDYILVLFDPYPYWDTLMKVIKPYGKICLIVDSSGLVDLRPLKDKCVTLTSESWFSRIKYNTDDWIKHHETLKEISKMLDQGLLKSTLTKVLTPFNVETMKEAHKIVEEKSNIGKVVVTGF